MPSAIASWCRETGQPEPETDGQMARCCLEALALKYRQVLRWMEELEATKVEVVHIVGGGSKNELLNQFTADACGCSVVAGPDEGTGIGNILIQARTAGEIGSLSDIRDVVRASSQLKDYEPSDRDAWAGAAAKLDELKSQINK